MSFHYLFRKVSDCNQQVTYSDYSVHDVEENLEQPRTSQFEVADLFVEFACLPRTFYSEESNHLIWTLLT